MQTGRSFLNWTYVNKMRTASQLDLCQQDGSSLSIGLMSTRCKEVEPFTTGLKPTRCEQPFNWTYVNKMRVDRTFRNWIYVNKMLTAFQLDLCQQDTNTLSIGLLSTRCEQVELFSTGLKSTRCQQSFNWTYVYKM